MLLEQREIVLNLLHCLGLLVNCKELIPTQEVDYFEAHFILNEGGSIPIRRKVSESSAGIHNHTSFSELLGLMTVCKALIPLPVYICGLSNYISSLCRNRTGTIC